MTDVSPLTRTIQDTLMLVVIAAIPLIGAFVVNLLRKGAALYQTNVDAGTRKTLDYFLSAIIAIADKDGLIKEYLEGTESGAMKLAAYVQNELNVRFGLNVDLTFIIPLVKAEVSRQYALLHPGEVVTGSIEQTVEGVTTTSRDFDPGIREVVRTAHRITA